MSKHPAFYVIIIALVVVLGLFAYMVQRTSAPMPSATGRPVERAPGSG